MPAKVLVCELESPFTVCITYFTVYYSIVCFYVSVEVLSPVPSSVRDVL